MIDPPRFEQVASIDSTNAELMRRPFSDQPQLPCILLADEQRAGRGRNGRVWLSDTRASLTMSVAFERSLDRSSLMGLPLVVGVCIAQVLREAGVAVRLKWPNDLYRDLADGQAKAGGILLEVRQFGGVQRIVAGCGLNLLPDHSNEPARTGQPSAALFEPDQCPERVVLAQDLGRAIASGIARFVEEGFAAFMPDWQALDLLADQPVLLLRPDGRRESGVARGVDGDGALVVQFDDGRREHCIGGEISVRRLASHSPTPWSQP
jgi:BirA family biotin operon repressor/biotin-[acetyl-CoA-carboxylase] ligase